MAEIRAIHECLFCPQTFDTATAKDDHVLEHFAQETCMECNQNLIRIGACMYTKHDKSTCVQRALKIEDQDRRSSVDSFSTQNHIEYALSKSNSTIGLEGGDEFSFTQSVLINTENGRIFNENSNDSMVPIKDPPDFEMNELFESQNQLPSYRIEPEVQIKIEEMDSYDEQFIHGTIDEHTNNRFDKLDCVTNTRKKLMKFPTKFECTICKKVYKNKFDHRRHMRIKHDPDVDKFKCKTCGFVFMQELSLENHKCKNPSQKESVSERKAKGSGEIPCDLCTTKFQSNANLRIHMRRKHDFSIDQFKCTQCSAVLLNESSRQSHNCSDDQALACDICERVFNAKSALRRHMRVNHDPDGCKFKCKSCGTILAQESSLQGHKCVPRARNLSTKYECNICSKVYQFKFNLRRHIRATHDPDVDKFKCKTCGFVFMQELSLQNHKCKGQRECVSERKAKGTGEIQCDLCSTKFHSNANLRKHKRIKHDSSIEKFRCTICRAIFLKESSLQSHICPRRHAYPCDICNKQLSRSHLLRIHKVLFHSAPGTIYCNVCGKLFTVADERDEHQLQCKLKKKMITLQLAGRFQCDLCNKVYKTKHDLRRHMRGKHNPDVDKFKCSTCGCVFVQESSLQKHECKGKFKNIAQRELIPCESCGKIVTRGGLRQHRIAFHSTPGTFCRTCFKAFSNNDELDAHRKKCILKRKTPRKCDICDKLLANPGALAHHKISLHSAPTAIFCKTCVKKFKTVDELNAHMPECTLKRKLQKLQKQNEQNTTT